MNAYVNDYSDKLDLKSQVSSARVAEGGKLKLKLNLNKIKEVSENVTSERNNKYL